MMSPERSKKEKLVMIINSRIHSHISLMSEIQRLSKETPSSPSAVTINPYIFSLRSIYCESPQRYGLDDEGSQHDEGGV